MQCTVHATVTHRYSTLNYVYSVPYRSKAMHFDSTFGYAFRLILGIISNYFL